jgi:hypothetical protein
LRDFKWVAPDPARQSPSTSTSKPRSSLANTGERTERVNAAIVIVLTLACTALAIFDLALLASGA